jgi:hypothetical protein
MQMTIPKQKDIRPRTNQVRGVVGAPDIHTLQSQPLQINNTVI